MARPLLKFSTPGLKDWIQGLERNGVVKVLSVCRVNSDPVVFDCRGILVLRGPAFARLSRLGFGGRSIITKSMLNESAYLAIFNTEVC